MSELTHEQQQKKRQWIRKTITPRIPLNTLLRIAKMNAKNEACQVIELSSDSDSDDTGPDSSQQDQEQEASTPLTPEATSTSASSSSSTTSSSASSPPARSGPVAQEVAPEDSAATPPPEPPEVILPHDMPVRHASSSEQQEESALPDQEREAPPLAAGTACADVPAEPPAAPDPVLANGLSSIPKKVIVKSERVEVKKEADVASVKQEQGQCKPVRRTVPKKPKSRFPQCKYCDGVFLSPVLLASHVQQHEEGLHSFPSPESLNRCGICDRRFYQPATLSQHMGSRHPECMHTPAPSPQDSGPQTSAHMEQDTGSKKRSQQPASAQPVLKIRKRNPQVGRDYTTSTNGETGTSSADNVPRFKCSHCETVCAILWDMELHILKQHEQQLTVSNSLPHPG